MPLLGVEVAPIPRRRRHRQVHRGNVPLGFGIRAPWQDSPSGRAPSETERQKHLAATRHSARIGRQSERSVGGEGVHVLQRVGVDLRLQPGSGAGTVSTPPSRPKRRAPASSWSPQSQRAGSRTSPVTHSQRALVTGASDSRRRAQSDRRRPTSRRALPTRRRRRRGARAKARRPEQSVSRAGAHERVDDLDHGAGFSHAAPRGRSARSTDGREEADDGSAERRKRPGLPHRLPP